MGRKLQEMKRGGYSSARRLLHLQLRKMYGQRRGQVLELHQRRTSEENLLRSGGTKSSAANSASSGATDVSDKASSGKDILAHDLAALERDMAAFRARRELQLREEHAEELRAVRKNAGEDYCLSPREEDPEENVLPVGGPKGPKEGRSDAGPEEERRTGEVESSSSSAGAVEGTVVEEVPELYTGKTYTGSSKEQFTFSREEDGGTSNNHFKENPRENNPREISSDTSRSSYSEVVDREQQVLGQLVLRLRAEKNELCARYESDMERLRGAIQAEESYKTRLLAEHENKVVY